MNLRNTALSGLGVLVFLSVFGLSAQAQNSDNPTPNTDLKQNRSSSLGGPITPTQTDLFAGSSTLLLQPITLEQESSSIFNVKPVRSNSNRPAAPFVDDPPRPSGVGIINVKTD